MVVALSWALTLLSAGCTEARKARARREPKAPASSPAAAAPAATAPAATAPPAASGAAPAPPVPPADLPGRATLQLSLPGKRKVGGFALTATYDPTRLVLGEPKTEEALAGYFCQANVATPGSIRFNCAGLPSDERGGLLATLPVRHSGAIPTPADVKVVESKVVDDLGQVVPDVHVELAFVAVAP